MKIKSQLAENYKTLKFGKNPFHLEKIEQLIQEAYKAGWNQAFKVMKNSSIFEYHSIKAIESDGIPVQNVIKAIEEELTALENEETIDI